MPEVDEVDLDIINIVKEFGPLTKEEIMEHMKSKYYFIADTGDFTRIEDVLELLKDREL